MRNPILKGFFIQGCKQEANRIISLCKLFPYVNMAAWANSIISDQLQARVAHWVKCKSADQVVPGSIRAAVGKTWLCTLSHERYTYFNRETTFMEQ